MVGQAAYKNVISDLSFLRLSYLQPLRKHDCWPRLGLAEQPHTETLRGTSNVQTKALDDLWCRAGS